MSRRVLFTPSTKLTFFLNKKERHNIFILIRKTSKEVESPSHKKANSNSKRLSTKLIIFMSKRNKNLLHPKG